jgi:prepilin-type processing-associated H-X9-DG protein/prepilin-type N-terminal cleavage/methylation domain-containing protein
MIQPVPATGFVSSPHGRASRSGARAFTLIELLATVAIIALLIAILIPALSSARTTARRSTCLANLHAIGQAIYIYAADTHDRTIPVGPEGGGNTGSNFYVVTGNVTSLISSESGQPLGLGLLIANYLSTKPKVLFCPGADQPSDAEGQLAKVGTAQAQSDYYYRHASITQLSGTPVLDRIRLHDLGSNSVGQPISALAMDVQFLPHPSFAPFGIVRRTAHNRKMSNVLFVDGHAESLSNSNNTYTVTLNGVNPQAALAQILAVFEVADRQR